MNITENYLYEIQKDKRITFPKEEHRLIKLRLRQGRIASTIRVGKEFGKYKLNKTYTTPWNDKIIITNVKRLKRIEDYEFFKYLTHQQMNEIKPYKDI